MLFDVEGLFRAFSRKVANDIKPEKVIAKILQAFSADDFYIE